MKWKLDHNGSVYLDLLRFVAAAVVFSLHTRNFLFPALHLGPLSWAREAVTVFFVLSGFVIFFVSENKELEWRSYAAARIARIYPVALLALAVTAIADSIGTSINPQYYEAFSSAHGGLVYPLSWTALLSDLTFTNQIWFLNSVFGTSGPYWSLGFEVQYYLFFFIAWYVRGTTRIILLLIWALFAGPKILMYLPIWLMGAVAAKLYSTNAIKGLRASAALIAISAALFLAAKFTVGEVATHMYTPAPLRVELYNFVYFTLIGLAVSMHLVGMLEILRNSKPINERATSIIRWLAGGSFTLYLAHQPIAFALSSIVHPGGISILEGVVALLLVLGLCWILSEIAERRKPVFGRLAKRAFKVPLS